MKLYSIHIISGCVLGVEHECVEDDNYFILSFLMIQIIFVW